MVMVVKKVTLLGLFVAMMSATTGLAQLERRISDLATGDTGNQPLPVDEAFAWFVSSEAPDSLQVRFVLAPEHYLYRHAFAFSLEQGGTETAIPFQLPAGLQKTDQFFGEVEAYYDQLNASLALVAEPSPDAVLWLEYQGCADWGFCYPPQRRSYPLSPPQ